MNSPNESCPSPSRSKSWMSSFGFASSSVRRQRAHEVRRLPCEDGDHLLCRHLYMYVYMYMSMYMFMYVPCEDGGHLLRRHLHRYVYMYMSMPMCICHPLRRH